MSTQAARGNDEAVQALRDERRRLQTLLASYHELGYDSLIPECRAEIARLTRKIRQRERAEPGAEDYVGLET